jgi:hypothetical protein
MRLSFLLALAAAGLVPGRTAAQVSGTIVLGGLPVGGVITFGVPYRVLGPARRVVIVERPGPARVIVVERWRQPKHYRRDHHQRYDRRVVWYDRRAGFYYDRVRPGLVRVEVYHRDGRYYRPDDDGRDRRDRRSGGRNR